jgi:predicted metal-dependent hydrolase
MADWHIFFSRRKDSDNSITGFNRENIYVDARNICVNGIFGIKHYLCGREKCGTISVGLFNDVVIRRNGSASGSNAVATRRNASASGSNVVATRRNASASGSNAIATCRNASTTRRNGSASGSNASASGSNDFATQNNNFSKMKNPFINDPDLGIIELCRNARARRCIIRLKPDRIQLTIPLGVSQEYALGFLREKRDWILVHKDKVQQPTRIISHENPLQSLTFITSIQPSPRKDLLFSLQNGILQILYPQTASIESEHIQTKIRQGVEAALRHEAKRILPTRLQQLSEKHHLLFSEIKIQQSKGRWGSCSSKKSINLSYWLLLLPEHLIDYVILHELCHTKEMNHSPRFWQLLDSLTGGQAKALAKEIKKYRTGVYS